MRSVEDAHLRRAQPGPDRLEGMMDNRYRDEHFTLDFLAGRAWVDSQPVDLTRKEYELLALLARNAREIVPRDVLLYRVWGYNHEIRTRTLDVHIGRVRKKLGIYGGRYIETIFGVGYRFQPHHPARLEPIALQAAA